MCLCLFGTLSTLTLHTHSGTIGEGRWQPEGAATAVGTTRLAHPQVWVTSVKAVSIPQVCCNVGHLWQSLNFLLQLVAVNYLICSEEEVACFSKTSKLC